MEIDILGKPPTQKEIDDHIQGLMEDYKTNVLAILWGSLAVFGVSLFVIGSILNKGTGFEPLISLVSSLSFGFVFYQIVRIVFKQENVLACFFALSLFNWGLLDLVFSVGSHYGGGSLLGAVAGLTMLSLIIIVISDLQLEFKRSYPFSFVIEVGEDEYRELKENMRISEISEYCREVGILERGVIRAEYLCLMRYSDKVSRKTSGSKEIVLNTGKAT